MYLFAVIHPSIHLKGTQYKKKKKKRFFLKKSRFSPNSHCGSAEMNPTRIHEDEGSILDLTQWVKDLALP